MKIKKLIVGTFLTGVAGLTLVACGNKNDNAQLVDENGKKYTVEKTEDPEKVAKVVDSIVREATSEAKPQKETKYGVSVKADANLKLNNKAAEEKYAISLNVEGNVKFDIPAPEKDEAGKYTETSDEYFSKLGFSASLNANAKSSVPGLTGEVAAGADLYSDEEKIYAKFGTFDLDAVKAVMSDSNAAKVDMVNVLLSGQKLSLTKDGLNTLIKGDHEKSPLDFTEAFPFIDAFYESGIFGLVMAIMANSHDDALVKAPVLDSYLVYNDAISTTEDEEDDEIDFSFTTMIAEFVDTFNISISKVDGNNVTFKLPIVEDISDYIKDYFDFDDPEYTHKQIKDIIDAEGDDALPVFATAYATLDVKKLLPVQLKVEGEKEGLAGLIQSKLPDPNARLRALDTTTSTSTSTSSSTSTSIPEYQVNRAKFLAALGASEVEDVSATVVIDFLYGKSVDTLSDSAKKDYKDATSIINQFMKPKTEVLR